jgi:hypothetical protein
MCFEGKYLVQAGLKPMEAIDLEISPEKAGHPPADRQEPAAEEAAPGWPVKC